MSFQIKIITLDATSEKSKALIYSIKEQGLNADFYSAIDGRKQYPKLLDSERIDQKKCFSYRLSNLSTGEVGCYLSHYRCIKEEFEKGTEKLCILEDDIHIEPGFASNINEILKLEKSFELVKIMGLKNKKRKITLTLNTGHKITRPIKGTLGTQGYVINRPGMEKVIKKGMPMFKPIDKFFDHFWETKIKTFSIEPHIIWEEESATSIVKPKIEQTVSITEKSKYKTAKLARSIKGLIFKLKNFGDFFPTEKTSSKDWKTRRKL